MSANLIPSILPGGPAPQMNGAAAAATGDAAAFLALLGGGIDLDGAAAPALGPPTEGAAPANPALALQMIPETTPQAPDADAAVTAHAAPAVTNQPAPDAPQTDDPALLAEAQPAWAGDADAEPDTGADTAADMADADQARAAPSTPAPDLAGQPIVVALQAAPTAPQPRAANAPSGEPKIDPNGASAQADGASPSAQPPAPPEAAPQDAPTARPDARAAAPDGKAASHANADAPAQAQTTNASASAPLPAATPEALAAGARGEAAAATQTDAGAAPRGAHLTPAAAALAQQIVRRFDGGSTRFEIRLDPPELGRVDVRLEVSRDKKVTATIAADNPQTLQDLTRAARELQRALADAGLDLSDNGLTFSDRREENAARFDNDGALRGRQFGGVEEEPAPRRPLGIERWGGSRVDVWV